MTRKRVATREQLERLRAAVEARMEELDGRTIEEVARRGGPSTTTMTMIRTAEKTPGHVTLRKLNTGLEWTNGSAYRLLWDGTPPVPLESQRQELGSNDASRIIDLAGAGGPLRHLIRARDEIDKAIAQIRSGDQPPR